MYYLIETKQREKNMNDLYLQDLFQANILDNIIYSSYIEDYFIFFTLLLSGYFVINYFIGYLIGKIPYINNIFNFKKFWLYIISMPIIIVIAKAMFSDDIFNIFLGKYLFVTIIVSLAMLILVYSGTKRLFQQYKIIQFYKDYSLSIIILIAASIYYYNYQFINNKNDVIQVLINKIDREITRLEKEPNADYKLAKLIVSYKVEAINGYINNLKIKEQNIINNFNTKIATYDNRYIDLSNKIDNSNELISNLELTYENKIKIIDKEIDEEKLRLKAIYEEWKNNVENNINNLDKLSKKYKLEIESLESNKDLITHLQNELKSIRQKNSKLNIELLKINDLISQNKDVLIKKLSNDIQKNKITIDSINGISSKNNISINNQLKEINKIKTIQVQLNKNKKNLDLIKADVDIIQKTIDQKQKQNSTIEN